MYEFAEIKNPFSTNGFWNYSKSFSNCSNSTSSFLASCLVSIFCCSKVWSTTTSSFTKRVLPKTKAEQTKDLVQDKIEHLREAAKASAEAFKTEMKSPLEEEKG